MMLVSWEHLSAQDNPEGKVVVQRRGEQFAADRAEWETLIKMVRFVLDARKPLE